MVVDKKIEREVGNLRREMNRKIEDKSGEIGAQLRSLEERSENLEVGLVELKSKSWSKDDLVNLYDELKKGDGGVMIGGLSYDEIRGLAREVVEKEIEKHASDGLGMVDYALGSAGAKVVSHSESLGKGVSFFVGKKNRVHNQAEKMLHPSFGEPRQCFPLKGSNGFVVIRLRAAIVPEAITLEHVAETRLTICAGCSGTECSDGDVDLFPGMVKYRGVKKSDYEKKSLDRLKDHVNKAAKGSCINC